MGGMIDSVMGGGGGGGGVSKQKYDLTPVSSGSNEGWYPLIGQNLANERGVTDLAIGMSPELRKADIDYLQTTANRESLINALKSREIEHMLSPDTQYMRQALPAEIKAEMEGGPNTRLSNQWLKQGLENVVATGARSDGGFARSALADDTRQSYIADRDRIQQKVGAWLQANPEPVAGLDPGALASAISTAASENANARDSYREGVIGLLQNNARSTTNATQMAMQMDAQQRSENANRANQSKMADVQLRSGNANAQMANATAKRGQNTALVGAGIGAVGAIAGGALILF